MGLTLRDTGGESQEPVSQAMHHAIAIGLWDLGTQINQTFQTSQQELVIMWEVPGERFIWKDKETGQETERPKVITRRFTASLSKKAHLRPFLEAWRGKPFTDQELNGWSIIAILKANCMIQVMHKPTKRGGMFPEVTAAMPIPVNTPKLTPERDPVSFNMETDTVIPEFTPNWIKNKILASPEWAQISGHAQPGQAMGQAGHGYEPPPPEYDDDIPF